MQPRGITKRRDAPAIARQSGADESTARLVFRDNDSGKVLLNISGKTLWSVDLTGAQLAGAAMYAVELVGGRASGSKIFDLESRKAALSGAVLRGANLARAVFSDETVVGVDFSGANLEGATFVRSHFIRSNFTGANLKGARFSNTAFSDCPSIAAAVGLDQVDHLGPSVLDVHTLRSTVRALPDSFLLGVGLTKEEIEHFRALYEDRVFYSCFISYARQDSDFADRLRSRLIRNGISCWQDTHDLRGGDFWRAQIDDAIGKHEKLVLVCSKNSVVRPSVVAEIISAIDREQASKAQKLFPIRLDDYVLSTDVEDIAKSAVERGEWKYNWLTYVRAYHMPDFSKWKDNRRFIAEFRKLLNALRHPATR